MEKTLSPDEKIRRAEEIYYRRKMQDVNKKSAKVNVTNKKEFGLLRKMFIQIVICIFVYVIFYMIQNTNYVFSEDVMKKTSEILSYDINIRNLYEQGINYINSFLDNTESKINNPEEENLIELNGNSDNQNIQNENINSVQTQNIGGENIVSNNEETVELTQMQQDAKDILESKFLIIPLKGTITSRFGLRDPKTPTVPKNHTGIDIAVNEGTVFVAAMSGIVEEVSSQRRFRKSF